MKFFTSSRRRIAAEPIKGIEEQFELFKGYYQTHICRNWDKTLHVKYGIFLMHIYDR